MRKFFLIGILLFGTNVFSQLLTHTKQCFQTADFVDAEIKKILKTETYSEVCVKIVTENTAKIWVSNNEFEITFSKNELLETNEKGILIYKGTGFIGEIKFEIIYSVYPDFTYHIALILMHNVPVKEYDKRIILQYKLRE